jgi:hypothetical protein
MEVQLMGENNQKIKLLRIMEYLRSESEVGKPVSTNQIINYLKGHNISCERRTLYKDMELLIESGANIVKTELGRENAYYIDEVSLSLAELKILIDAVQAANFITDIKTAELVEKLLAFSGIRRSEIVRDNIILYNNHKHSNGDIYENIEQIELFGVFFTQSSVCIVKKEELIVNYSTHTNKGSCFNGSVKKCKTVVVFESCGQYFHS